MPKLIVIGAGVAGIATAIRAAVQGYDVTVFEQNSYPGGKLAEIRENGFRFDAGPSLFTMPQYVDELFLLAGKNPRDYFTCSKLDLVCNYFYEDGTSISAWADADRFAREVAAHTADNAVAVKKFLAKSGEIYGITSPVFLERSLHKVRSYLNLQTLRSLLRLPAIDPFRTMNEANSRRFRDAKTIQLFNRYATYNGSDPYQAPATLNVIPHLEHHFGAWFPQGGMYNITRALVRLAEELQVTFEYNAPVQEIMLSSRKVTGITSRGQFHPADAVVSNMDVYFTYTRLLKKIRPPKHILRQERSSSALIFYWGISGAVGESLDLHNIFFSEDYAAEFNAIWKAQRIYEDPTVYVNISAKLEAADAPPGCENWFVMINVPADSGQDWEQLTNEARKHVLTKLSRNLGKDVASAIVSESVLGPRGIGKNTSSYRGSIYGTSSNSKYAAFLRHANRSATVHGLYFAGGSVHPGGGIPLALLSAKIVAGMLRQVKR
ncbi:1-hydroxycarotenoid 3,4-desaturase CrtD [Hufsiella ginkgonis]|uniref:Phytoene desaturase n=1 Tax=Hufsiella ginkgonis TaxID=2695274 RepID=A0A7K1XUU2_9SPHI|nr:1-hydroxycarotenoid 3,4-desaturase CrtD [Hufsiella ginkgonis]MXV14752.1 phytoene desaturase [Hufsiella ginkgonis]